MGNAVFCERRRLLGMKCLRCLAVLFTAKDKHWQIPQNTVFSMGWMRLNEVHSVLLLLLFARDGKYYMYVFIG